MSEEIKSQLDELNSAIDSRIAKAEGQAVASATGKADELLKSEIKNLETKFNEIHSRIDAQEIANKKFGNGATVKSFKQSLVEGISKGALDAIINGTSRSAKFETGVSPGDTLYFHHHVVVNDGQPLTGEKDSYIVNYSETALNNQAIAYRKKGTDEVTPLGGWVVLEPVVEEKEKLSEIIEVIEFKEETINKGKVVFYADYFDEIGINIGNVVAFNPKFGYKFKIDGKDYLRIRLIDLLYVETN